MRIVSHSCSNTEIICKLGLQHLIVGVDNHSDTPSHIIKNIPKIGDDLSPSIEKIIELNPDIVIASNTIPGHEKFITQLEKVSINHVVINPISLKDIKNSFVTISKAIGFEEKGTFLANQFDKELNQMKDFKAFDRKPNVMVEWWPKPTIAACQFSWVNEMLEIAGAINPFASITEKSKTISLQEIEDKNIDGIIISWCGVKPSKYKTEIVRKRQGWESINAIKKNNIFAISEEYLGRPGPRVIEGIKKIKECVQKIGETN